MEASEPSRKRARQDEDQEMGNPEQQMSAQPKKKVKAKRRLQGAANASGANPSSGAAVEAEEMKNDSDISFEDSQEDEFEQVEIFLYGAHQQLVSVFADWRMGVCFCV